MKVLDFINEYVDCMNERDFFNTLNTLADLYALSLSRIGIKSGEDIHDSTLLSGFLLQEIKETGAGRYTLAKEPSIGTLRFLNMMIAKKGMR